MSNNPGGRTTSIKKVISRRMVAGMLVLVPVGVTLLVMRWLFELAAGFLTPLVRQALSGFMELPKVQEIPEVYINLMVSILAILILLMLLYVIGAVGQYVIGKKLIGLWEALWMKIPLVSSIYGATRSVMQAVSLPQHSAFKSVIVVEFPCPGFRAIGFLCGYWLDTDGNRFARIFIPNAPNPTTGFLEIVSPDRVRKTNLTTEEAFKMIISGGILSTDKPLQTEPLIWEEPAKN
jgi:uncharacterized membrane protein